MGFFFGLRGGGFNCKILAWGGVDCRVSDGRPTYASLTRPHDISVRSLYVHLQMRTLYSRYFRYVTDPSTGVHLIGAGSIIS